MKRSNIALMALFLGVAALPAEAAAPPFDTPAQTAFMKDLSSGAILYAKNADEAVGILESRSDIRIVFTDVDMPGSMDGIKLAAAVRDRWPPIRIIVVSGHKKVTPSELPDGARFFAKPYDEQHLVEALVAMAT